ncbi:hypothetical protein [Streptomyces fagopyri]
MILLSGPSVIDREPEFLLSVRASSAIFRGRRVPSGAAHALKLA